LTTMREEFDVWLSSRYSNPFWVGHHRFEKSVTGEVRIDNGVFNREEALIIHRMLRSRNPLTRVNANFVIWERNRTLLILLAVVTIILLAIVLIRIER
jgi:hypothetical protein